MKKVHIIGHSLGAQIAGFAGKSISKSAGAKVGWITGLDPAGPLYEVPLQSKGGRLSDQDADVVEVIHTDGGVLGFATPTGTVDFYPNGGTFVQPNCVSFSVNAAGGCGFGEGGGFEAVFQLFAVTWRARSIILMLLGREGLWRRSVALGVRIWLGNAEEIRRLSMALNNHQQQEEDFTTGYKILLAVIFK